MPELHAVAVARTPLRFNPPPGWPEAGGDWAIEHQGWTPPAGWTPPGTDLPAAPDGWTFWTPDESAFSAYAAPWLQPYRVRTRRGIAAAILGLVAAIVLSGLGGTIGGFAPLALGATVFGAGTAAVAAVAWARARARLVPRLVGLADRLREVSERRAYERVARELGDDAPPFASFCIDRESDLWRGAAADEHRPGDLFRPVHDDGEVDEWALVEPEPSSMPSLVAVGAVVLVLIGGFYVLNQGDGRRSLAFEERFDDASKCSTASCWVWQVQTKESCKDATALVGLNLNGSQAVDRTVEVPLGAIRAGRDVEVRLEFDDGMPDFAGITEVACAY